MILAASPATITLPEMFYDHGKQRSVVTGPVQEAQRTTWNGTQTYNYQGRPSDNDND
jgi:hypothetical protein